MQADEFTALCVENLEPEPKKPKRKRKL
jgi:hypothetical protein